MRRGWGKEGGVRIEKISEKDRISESDLGMIKTERQNGRGQKGEERGRERERERKLNLPCTVSDSCVAFLCRGYRNQNLRLLLHWERHSLSNLAWTFCAMSPCTNLNFLHLSVYSCRPDMTFTVDWALKTNYLSIYTFTFWKVVSVKELTISSLEVESKRIDHTSGHGHFDKSRQHVKAIFSVVNIVAREVNLYKEMLPFKIDQGIFCRFHKMITMYASFEWKTQQF